jgi:hypothetical protein
MGRRITIDAPDTDFDNITHTAAGRVKNRTWERGNHTRYDYRRGFLVAQRHFTSAAANNGTNAGNDADTPDIDFRYDAVCGGSDRRAGLSRMRSRSSATLKWPAFSLLPPLCGTEPPYPVRNRTVSLGKGA